MAFLLLFFCIFAFMYTRFIRPLLFLLPPETAHVLTMACLNLFCRLPYGKKLLRTWYRVDDDTLKKTILGITFPNPVGLAAGFDKDARYTGALACLGFGFIEIGTLTPVPQSGNPKPRLFRLPKDKALVNRMGFNNQGAAAAACRLRNRIPGVIIGGNVGKNKNTPNETALRDYLACIDALYDVVDYFVINVSSPNTPGLRELQDKQPLRQLLSGVKARLLEKPAYKPMLLKIAPDLTNEQLDEVIAILKETKTDGIIATNTTVSRDGLNTSPDVIKKIGPGGLSGKPLQQKSNEIIRYLRSKLGPGYPIIGVGGIMTAEDAIEKLKAGADLIQLYTGFVYRGPALVKRILLKLKQSHKQA